MRTLTAKLQDEVGLTSEQNYPVMSESHYLKRLEALHLRLQPQTYLEIGTESGASLSFARCASIAVDPAFRLEGAVMAGKSELHLFQKTSDDFFASGFLESYGRKIDFAFLDGLHLFEFLLRDFIGAERHANPTALIAMHDCVPTNAIMANRRWLRRKTKHWTGDVWKIIPALREYRPDLKVAVRDYAPTGLVEITNLDPANTTLSDKYDEIVSRYIDLNIEEFGLERFHQTLDVQRVSSPPVLTGNGRTIAIKHLSPSGGVDTSSGDYYFATSLAAALRRIGQEVRIDQEPEWAPKKDDALDIVLQGHGRYPAGPERPALLWYLYPGKRFPLETLSEYAHVFVPSERAADRLLRRAPKFRYSILPQCYDSDRFPPSSTTRSDIPVFVGNNHFSDIRPIVNLAVQSGVKFDLWGGGWSDSEVAPMLLGEHVENDALNEIYGQAAAVLCDQTPAMSRFGILSNRYYDALASGSPVISFPIPDVPEKLRPFIHFVETPSEFEEALNAIRNEPQETRDARTQLALRMASEDSFDARARTMVDKARELGLIR